MLLVKHTKHHEAPTLLRLLDSASYRPLSPIMVGIDKLRISRMPISAHYFFPDITIISEPYRALMVLLIPARIASMRVIALVRAPHWTDGNELLMDQGVTGTRLQFRPIVKATSPHPRPSHNNRAPCIALAALALV